MNIYPDMVIYGCIALFILGRRLKFDSISNRTHSKKIGLTVCPRSPDPFYIVTILFKVG